MSIPFIAEWLKGFGKGKVIFQGSGNTALTYTKVEANKDWKSVCITNDGILTLQFKVNGLTIDVKSYETFDDTFDAFKTFEILNNIAYRLILRA